MTGLRARIVGFGVVGAAAFAASCSVVADFNGLVGAAGDGGPGSTSDGSPNGADGAINGVDGGNGNGGDGGGVGNDGGGVVDGGADGSVITIDSGCKDTGKGPSMVAADSFCIDSTDVTNTQYAAFLAANVAVNSQPAYCAFNTTFAVECTPSNTAGDAPVTCVNWCDARAFCAWAGKRLCGAIGGGPGSVANLTSAAADQWYHACSRGGALSYPYGNGNAYKPAVCDDTAYGANASVVVASLPGCEGPYVGLYDMLGNAVEWVDVCASTSGASDQCYIRGSAFDDGNVDCTGNATQNRDSFDNTKGFRCCSL